MKANIKYFGMIAEKIRKSEESVDLDEKNQSDLRNYFVQKYPFLNDMDYQIAVNQNLTEVIDTNTEFVEIALLPPFAGG
jgi:molybdopterin synthase sulfur carrier subunit|tara:strand:+ start:1777 stop:2013 length:237 start_codon:yes stop_codon:yes gene_type:complete